MNIPSKSGNHTSSSEPPLVANNMSLTSPSPSNADLPVIKPSMSTMSTRTPVYSSTHTLPRNISTAKLSSILDIEMPSYPSSVTSPSASELTQSPNPSSCEPDQKTLVLTSLSWNIEGIKRNLFSLKNLINKAKPDFIFLS